VFGIPQLPPEEDVFAFHDTLLDPQSDLDFIAIYGHAVKIAISRPQSDIRGLFHLLWCRLPGSKAYRRDLDPFLRIKASGRGIIVDKVI